MKTKLTLFFIAAVLITYMITDYLAVDRASKLEQEYYKELSNIEAHYAQQLDSVRLLKLAAYDSLIIIADERLYTIEELKNRPNEANDKIRIVVRDYRNHELDSIIRSMFSDLSRFD